MEGLFLLKSFIMIFERSILTKTNDRTKRTSIKIKKVNMEMALGINKFNIKAAIKVKIDIS